MSDYTHQIQRLGLHGFGGNCGFAAIVINRCVFQGKGTYVAGLNDYLLDTQDRWVGHVVVKYQGKYYDSEGQKTADDILSWGMLDTEDADYDNLTDDDAQEASLYEVTEAEIMGAFGISREDVDKYNCYRTAAPKDRAYLESLNLKQLQKTQKSEPGQDKRTFYQKLQEQSKSGPLFDTKTLVEIERLPELPKHLTKWLGSISDTDLAKLDAEDVNKLANWATNDARAKSVLQDKKLTTDQVMINVYLWEPAKAELKQHSNTAFNLVGGYYAYELTSAEELQMVGQELQNCLEHGAYDDELGQPGWHIYSIADKKGNDHIVIEVDDGHVKQCVGKQNDTPTKKYHPVLADFFTKAKLWDGFYWLPEPWPDFAYTVMANSHETEICRVLAQSNFAPVNILRSLVNHEASIVRHALAFNPNTPKDTLVQLTKDRVVAVAQAAKETLEYAT